VTTTITDDELFRMVKVQMDHRETFDIDNLAVVSVEDNPPEVKEGSLSAADLDLVRRYLTQNRSAIVDHWHERTDGVELSRALKPLRYCCVWPRISPVASKA
jgi:hypothetical protein